MSTEESRSFLEAQIGTVTEILAGIDDPLTQLSLQAMYDELVLSLAHPLKLACSDSRST